MNNPLKIIRFILKVTNPSESRRIYLHLILSILTCLADLLFYQLIAKLDIIANTNLNLFGEELTGYFIIILILGIISILRFLTLKSTVFTTAIVGKSLHMSLLYSYIKQPYELFAKNERTYYLDKLSRHVEYANNAFFSSLQVITTSTTIIVSGIYVVFNASKVMIIGVSLSVLFYWVICQYSRKKLIHTSERYQISLREMMSKNSHLLASFRSLFFRQTHEQELINYNNDVFNSFKSGSLIAYYSSFTRFIIDPLVLLFALFFITNISGVNQSSQSIAVIISLLRATTVLQALYFSWGNLTGYSSFVKSLVLDIKIISF